MYIYTGKRCRLFQSSPLFLFIVLLVIRFLVEAFVLNDTWYGWNFGVVVMLANIVSHICGQVRSFF